jgi:Tol biopolymer transport system component
VTWADLHPDDLIRYRVSDGTVASQPATLALHVTPGAAPIATAVTVSGDEDHQITIALTATDPDDDAVDFTVATQPKHGTLSGDAPNLVYTPNPDFNGDDVVEFTVSDGYFTSDKAAVTIHVIPVDDAPIATAQAVPAVEDSAVEISLAGTDVEGHDLSFRVVDLPQHGTLSSTTGSAVTYRPALNYRGPDRFRFVANDGTLDSEPAAVDLNVAGTADPPVAMSFERELDEDAQAAVTLVGSDPDGDPLSFAMVTPPAHGALDGVPPNVTYTPARDFHGADSFTYTVSDGATTSEPGTVTLHVAPVNDAPVAVASAVETNEDAAVDVPLPASDVDGDSLTYTIVTAPADGRLTGSGASRQYVPARNVNGARSLTFRVSDTRVTTDATVTITIRPVNDPPTPVTDFAATDPGTALTLHVTSNDLDIDGDTLALASVDPPLHGAAEIVDGKLRFTPDDGFTGIETLRYTVVDGQGGSARGAVHMGVGDFPRGAPTERLTIGPPSFAVATGPSVSSNGRFIAFETRTALIGGDDNDGFDVYLYDRGSHTISLVSADRAGHPGNARSQRPHISGNGRYVVFESDANNLIANDRNQRTDVFRHDRVTGETLRVSVAADGSEANRDSFDAQASDDGSLVAFGSTAFNLAAAGDANGAPDVFVRDVVAGTTERISVGHTGGETDLGSIQPAISGDGRFVAFTSAATNLVAGDTNDRPDVFLRNRVAGTTTRISVSTNDGESNGESGTASVSRDGRFVLFGSDASNLVSDTFVGTYVRDVQSRTTIPLSVVAFGPSQLSADGQFVVSLESSFFTSRAHITDRFIATASTLASAWYSAAISGNAHYVAAHDSFGGGQLVMMSNPLSP